MSHHIYQMQQNQKLLIKELGLIFQKYTYTCIFMLFVLLINEKIIFINVHCMYRYLLIVVYFDSHSLQSEESESDTDLVESGSNAASPSFIQDKETFVFMTLQNDEVEDVWKAHIANVMSESSAVLTVKTSQIFPRLYRVCFLSSFNTWKWFFF